MKYQKSFPDLRINNDEFTIEHCSVLLERLGTCLDSIYDDGDFKEIANEADPQSMLEDLLTIMNAKQLAILFQSELGKGMIIGAFYSQFILPQEELD